MLFEWHELGTANVGDSRALLCRFDPERNVYVAIPLSDDHKPDRPDEQQRILENHGQSVSVLVPVFSLPCWYSMTPVMEFPFLSLLFLCNPLCQVVLNDAGVL